MKLLPYDNFHIVTKLTPNEVQKRLETVLSASRYGEIKTGRHYISNAIFFGFLLNRKFNIKLVSSHRNIFNPIIKGSIEESLKGGSCIHIKMHLSEAVMFIAGCFAFSAVLGLIVVSLIDINRGVITGDILIYICMILFAYLFCIYGFSSQRDNTVSTLTRIFESE
jgi:hypothetical protein